MPPLSRSWYPAAVVETASRLKEKRAEFKRPSTALLLNEKSRSRMRRGSFRLEAPPEIESDRLQLRHFCEADWRPLYDFFRDEECVRYTIKTPLEEWQTWRMLACYIGHWTLRGYGPYAVVEKASGEVVGTVGLWFPGELPEPELKWALRRRFWGKGYATEAAGAVRDMTQRSLK